MEALTPPWFFTILAKVPRLSKPKYFSMPAMATGNELDCPEINRNNLSRSLFALSSLTLSALHHLNGERIKTNLLVFVLWFYLSADFSRIGLE